MRRNFTFFILILLSFQFNSFSQRNVTYSWNEDYLGSDNIVPMTVLYPYHIQGASLGKIIRDFKPDVTKLPPGHRVIRVHSNTIVKILQNNPHDTLFCSSNCKTGTWKYNGIPYNGVWLNNGMDSLERSFTRFFSALKDSGVIVDEIILDTENDEARSNVEENADNRYGGGTTSTGIINRLNYYKAINADDRFKATFKDTFEHYINRPYHDSLFYHDVFKSWDTASTIWTNMAEIIMKAYKDTAVYFPVKKVYPNIRLSEYNYRYYSKKYPVPSRTGNEVYKWGHGSHLGTHQTVNLYGDIKNNLVTSGRGIPLTIYPATVFNALVYDINNLRAATLSSPVPVKSWIASKNWTGDQFFAYLYKNNDYYQELVLHTLLSGSGIIYWNAGHTLESDRLMSDLLHQFDTLTGYGLGNGYKDPKHTLTDLLPWGYRGRNDTCCSNYFITAMKINSTDVDYDTLWRFTPLLGNSPLSTIDSNSIKKMVVSSSNPVKVRLKYDKSLEGGAKVIGYDTIVFPGATRIIYSTDTLSPNGFWIANTRSSNGIESRQETISLIKIYPNPSKGLLNIQSDDQIEEVKLFNLLGENVLNFFSPGEAINISQLSAGIYTIAIRASNKQWRYQKLIMD